MLVVRSVPPQDTCTIENTFLLLNLGLVYTVARWFPSLEMIDYIARLV